MQCQTTLEQLSEFLQRDDARAEIDSSLCQHVGQCHLCQSRLDRLTDDPVLVAAAKRYTPTGADTSVLRHALDRVKATWRKEPAGSKNDARNGGSTHVDPVCLLDPVRLLDPVSSLDCVGQTGPANRSDLGNIGRYQIKSVLGRGGMSIVFAGWDPMLERRVAIKVCHSHEDPHVWKRFVREARAAARMAHDAVVPVYEVIERDGQPPALIMPLMAGGTLADQIGRRFISPRRAAGIVARVADGLQEVHRQGHVHRDIKPANLLFDRQGRAHLGDFSLVRREDDQPLTEANVLPGTPEYIAPEILVDGAAASTSSDIYQLGLTLYVMLTGVCPYQGTVRGVLRQIIDGPPPRPRKYSDKIPKDLETICLKATDRNPAERYPTSGELSADLNRFLSDESILARRPGLPTRVRRWARRHSNTTAVVGIAVPCSILMCMGYAAYQKQAREFARQHNTIDRLRDAERAQLVEETHRAEIAELRSDQMLSQSLTAVFAAKQIREPRWIDTEQMLVNSLLGGFEQGFEQMRLAPQRAENLGETALSIAKLRARVDRMEDARDAFEQAIGDFDRRLKDSPSEQLAQWISDALRGHGAACTKLQRPAMAVRSLQRACDIAGRQSELHPASLKWQLERLTSETEYGHALIASNAFDQAGSHLAIASSCIRTITDTDGPLFDLVGFRELFAEGVGELARAYRDLGDLEKAVAAQSLAVAQNDLLGDDEIHLARQADARAVLSELLAAVGDANSADSELQQAIVLIDRALAKSDVPGRYEQRRATWLERSKSVD